MWTIGDRVLGRRQDDGYWYTGTIRHTDGDRFYVIFDDGEDELLPAERLRPVELEVGDRVFARAGAAGEYAPGTITGKKGEKLRIRFEDGAHEWTSLARTRIDPDAPPPEADPSRPRGWALGDRVLACWHDLFWYPGSVFAVSGAVIHVLFDSGNQALVTADKVRALNVDIGDRILCLWKGGPAWYAGEVKRRDGEVIHIHYDDGDEETTLVRLTRLERDDWFPDYDVSEIAEGDRVLASWFDQNWYPGVVVSVTGKRVHVLFDDGDQAMVTPDRIKPLEFRKGDRVYCRRQGGPVYFAGEIARVRGEVIHVDYDDGEKEVTSVRFVRIEREGYRESFDA